MKKLFSVIVAFALIVSIYSLPTYACGNLSSIKPYSDKKIMQNDLEYSYNILAKKCSHSWSAWQAGKETYVPGNKITDCVIRRTPWTRTCTKCGEKKHKNTDHQMQHKWTKINGIYHCGYCGMQTGKLRILDENE